MRITRKKYDRAKAVVADAREQMQVIKRWDEAIKHVERPELVDAVTINDDGSLRFEVLHESAASDAKSTQQDNSVGDAK